MSRRTIEGVQFGADGVRISYMNSNDVRAEGEIYHAHTIAISWANEALADAVTALEDAADALLAEALTTWARTAPVDLEAEREKALALDDNDEGLGGGE